MRTFTRLCFALPLLFTTGCVISIGGKSSWLSTGWSNLDYEHVEVLDLGSNLDYLAVGSGSGDVTVRADGNSPRIVATIREEEPDDGYLVLDDGKLQVRSRSGNDVALGDIEVFLGGVTHELLLSTGSGNVLAEHVSVDGRLFASTGSGDITIANVGRMHRLDLATGSGDVMAVEFACAELDVDTGSGEIEVIDAKVGSGSFDTGSGDVRLAHSVFEHVDVDTGSGDLDARGSQIGTSSFSTGSGRIEVGN